MVRLFAGVRRLDLYGNPFLSFDSQQVRIRSHLCSIESNRMPTLLHKPSLYVQFTQEPNVRKIHLCHCSRPFNSVQQSEFP